MQNLFWKIKHIFYLFPVFIVFICYTHHSFGQEVIRFESEEQAAAASYRDSIQVDSTARPPSYPGGEDAFFLSIEQFLSSPEWRGIVNPIRDEVTFEFIVNKEGTVENFKIKRTTNIELNRPLKLAIEGMKWEPRIREGNAVETRISYAISLRSIYEFPYLLIEKIDAPQTADPSTKQVKIFIVVGALLIMAALLIL